MYSQLFAKLYITYIYDTAKKKMKSIFSPGEQKTDFVLFGTG